MFHVAVLAQSHIFMEGNKRRIIAHIAYYKMRGEGCLHTKTEEQKLSGNVSFLLINDPFIFATCRFIQVETYFFWMWWQKQKEAKKDQVM